MYLHLFSLTLGIGLPASKLSFMFRSLFHFETDDKYSIFQVKCFYMGILSITNQKTRKYEYEIGKTFDTFV